MKILQIIPANGWKAVYGVPSTGPVNPTLEKYGLPSTDPDKPILERRDLVCFGLVEEDPGDVEIVGFDAMGPIIDSIDACNLGKEGPPVFLGYEGPNETDDEVFTLEWHTWYNTIHRKEG